MRPRAFATATSTALLSLLLLLAGAGAGARAQTLTTDASAAPYHSVVHLSVAAAPGNSIAFTDNGAPLLTLPLTPQGTAVLGIATLLPGPHTITAGASNPVNVTIAPLPSTFQWTPTSQNVFLNTSLAFALTGLPPLASGTLTYSENGVSFQVLHVVPSPHGAYQAFGDSITDGYLLYVQADRYPNLLASANDLPYYSNFADPAAISCDVLPHYILPRQAGPTQDTAPLYTLMIGSTDMDAFGTPLGEPNYTTCHQAALSWLGIPREYKILPGDPAATILSGPWQLPPPTLDSTYQTLYNSSGTGAASFQITSNGGPLYLWYLMGDHLNGAFTVALDGVPTGTTYTTHPAIPIYSLRNPDSVAFALLRLPVPPGPHTLRVDLLSGTAGILGVATPPSPGIASKHPTVLSADVPNQNLTQAVASPAAIARFSADAMADVALLQADGLDIRPVPTHAFLGTSPAEFVDYAHPTTFGHQELAAAFQAVLGTSSLLPYQQVVGPDTIPASFFASTLGPRTVTAAYSGDAVYAPYSVSTVVQVVPDSQSITTLTAPATTFSVGNPVTANAVIFPPNPGALVALMEGNRVLTTVKVATNAAAFSLPSLPVGLHTLHAAYGGDSSNAGSNSPPLQVQVLQNTPALILTAPAHLPYATPISLSATLSLPTATGTVLFADAYTPNGQAAAQAVRPLAQVTLTNGTATLAPAQLAPGTHTLTATYSGDTDDASIASAPTTLLIDPIPTATLLSSPTPAPAGQPTSFAATVTPSDSTGTVTFTDLTSGLSAQVALAGGTAAWSTSALTAGPHTLQAAYSGDPAHASSASATLPATIARAPSALALSAPASLLFGNPVTLTASVTPANATGTVLFADPAAGTLGQAPVLAGVANLVLPSLPPGIYSLTATYSGDPGTLPSFTPVPAPLQILSDASTTTLSVPASSPYASPVSLSVTVAPSPASGLVRFSDNGNPLGTIALNAGSATFTTAGLSAGPHTLSAVYLGDSTHNTSTASATLNVTPAASTTALSLSQPTVLAGSPAVFTVRVAAAGAPGGTVSLRSGSATLATATLGSANAGTAYATLAVPTASTGTYPVTAFYSGDANTTASDSSSSAALAYTVAPRIASGVLNLSATQVPPLAPVTLRAAFTSPGTSGPALVPTGSVTFLLDSNAMASAPLDASGQASATLPSAALGAHTLTAVYTPTGVFSAAAVTPQTLRVTPPLALAFATPTLSMSPASTADATLTLTPLSGFQGAVALACTSPQTYLTCSVDTPSNLTATTTARVHLKVAANANSASLPGTTARLILALLLPLAFAGRRRRPLPALLLLLLAATITTALTGCAEGGSFGNVPTGANTILLTATAANTPTTATLTVTIQQ